MVALPLAERHLPLVEVIPVAICCNPKITFTFRLDGFLSDARLANFDRAGCRATRTVRALKLLPQNVMSFR